MTINPEIARVKTIDLLDKLTKRGGVDLHLHTVASDGSDTPEEIVAIAKERGLRAIAIADHDNIESLPKAEAAVRRLQEQNAYELTLIPAVELAVTFENKPVHLLAYFACSDIAGMDVFLAEQRKNRLVRNEQMLRKLTELGMPVTQDELDSYKEGDENRLLGRTHIALLLVKKGYAASITDAFHKYLNSGKPAYVPRKRASLATACELIHGLGGAAILAHPQHYGWCGHDSKNIPSAFLIEKLQAVKEMGIDGIESFHGDAGEIEQRELLQAAQALDMISVAGSDYHGLNKDNTEMYHADSKFYP